MIDPKEVAASLAGQAEEILRAAKRFYGAPWSDWPGGYTSCHTHPVLYAIWAGPAEDVPLYIGHTTDLGSRLDRHCKSGGWSRTPTHASFIEAERFRDDAYRTLVERFLIMALDPTDNDRSR